MLHRCRTRGQPSSTAMTDSAFGPGNRVVAHSHVLDSDLDQKRDNSSRGSPRRSRDAAAIRQMSYSSAKAPMLQRRMHGGFAGVMATVQGLPSLYPSCPKHAR